MSAYNITTSRSPASNQGLVGHRINKIESKDNKVFTSNYNKALSMFFTRYFSKDKHQLLTENLLKIIKQPQELKKSFKSIPECQEILKEIEKKLLLQGDKKCQIYIYSILNANNFEKFFSDKKSLNIPKDKFLEYCTTKVVDFHRKNPSAKIFKLNTKNIGILFQRFQKKQQHFHQIPVATVLESIPYTSPNSDARANSRIIPSATVREAIPTGDVSQQKLFARAGGIVPLTNYNKSGI